MLEILEIDKRRESNVLLILLDINIINNGIIFRHQNGL